MKYAVGFLSFFDNDLVVNIVEADSVKEAICKHESIAVYEETEAWLSELPDDLETLKEEFFNGDLAVDVVEIA